MPNSPSIEDAQRFIGRAYLESGGIDPQQVKGKYADEVRVALDQHARAIGIRSLALVSLSGELVQHLNEQRFNKVSTQNHCALDFHIVGIPSTPEAELCRTVQEYLRTQYAGTGIIVIPIRRKDTAEEQRCMVEWRDSVPQELPSRPKKRGRTRKKNV